MVKSINNPDENSGYTRCAKLGDTIIFHYKACVDGNNIIASTSESEPIQRVLGKGQINRTVETKIVGMSEGEIQNFTLPSIKAVSLFDEKRFLSINNRKFNKFNSPTI